MSLRGIAGRRTPSCLGLPDDRRLLGDNVSGDRDRLGNNASDDHGLSENNVPDEPDCSDGDTPNCHGLSGSYTTSGRRE